MSELVDRVYNGILEYISENSLSPGDRLPSERALSEMFSVSRPAIRGATRMLNVQNIIEVRKGGMYVSSLEADIQSDYFDIFLKSGQVSFDEVLEVRLMLEVECAGLAATRITDAQLKDLNELLSNVDVNDPEKFADADKRLHHIIYTSTGNKALLLLARMVNAWAIVSRNFTNSFIEVRQVVHIDHLNLVNALSQRDVEKSREAMRQHLIHLQQINVVRNKMKVELSKLIENNYSAETG